VQHAAATRGRRRHQIFVADQLHGCRHHDRPDDEGVQQDAQRDHEAEIEGEGHRQRHQHREGAARMTPGARMNRPVAAIALSNALAGSVLRDSSRTSRHQEDRVVDPQCHQEDEREGWDRRVEASIADDEADEEDRDPQRAGE